MRQLRVILASASPRRLELLETLFSEFEVIPALGEEISMGDTPKDVVLSLAEQKAMEVAGRLESFDQETLILSADTVVAIDDRSLGKPADAKDAKNMLRLLSGRTHQVYTGVMIWHYKGGKQERRHFCECTDVTFCRISEEELESYVSVAKPMDEAGECINDTTMRVPEWKDKAGAYAIQGYAGSHWIKEIHGDYYNVVGLPLSRLYQELKVLIFAHP